MVVDRYAVLRLPREVLFGRETRFLTGWAVRRVGQRPILCVDPFLPESLVSDVVTSLAAAGLEPIVFSATFGGSTTDMVDAATRAAEAAQVDVVIALGGGTTLDLGKLVALSLAWPGPLSRWYGERLVSGPCFPLVSLPTTAGTGSEISPVAIVVEPGAAKGVISDPWLVPAVAICDPVATLTCPASVTADAGMDALVNAMESFTAAHRADSPSSLTEPVFIGNSDLTRDYALGAVGLVGGSLAAAVADGDDIDAREAVLLGSLRAALAFSQSGTGAVHALVYPVESRTGVRHGLGVGLLLPYVLSYNGAAQLAEHAAMARAVGIATRHAGEASSTLVDWVVRLKDQIGLPRSLADIGLREAALDEIADEALSNGRLIINNGRRIDRDGLRRILRAAWIGDPSIAAGNGSPTRGVDELPL